MKQLKKDVRKATAAREKAEAKKQARRAVKVTLEHGSVLEAPGDVLALKYAQARHGADRGAAKRFLAAGDMLPDPGEWEAAKLVKSPKGIAATHTLVVGTHRLWEHEPEFRYQFGYGDVRRLNEMFVSSLVGHSVKSVVTTLHGEGVDLDMFGVFDATVAGIQSAVKQGRFPATLERFSIALKNPDKRDVLQRRLEEMLPPDGTIESDTPPVDLGAPSGPPDVFVIMSFDRKLESVYSKIQEGVHAVQWPNGQPLTCVRMDSNDAGLGPGVLLPQIQRSIRKAEFAIVVLTPAPGEKFTCPNVAFELGTAHQVLGEGKVVLVTPKNGLDIKKTFSDLAGHVFLIYNTLDELKDKVREQLIGLVNNKEDKKKTDS